MQWYRSWPAEVPPGRAYVQDSLSRLVMTQCDYRTVEGGWPRDEPGICLLEWDVALDGGERERFEGLASENPDRVLVAPYTKSYADVGRLCVHRIMRPKDSSAAAWRQWFPLPEGQAKTDLFGFGCIYMPLYLMDEFVEHRRGFLYDGYNDTNFSTWYLGNYGQADVTWDVHPQHLNGD